MTEQPMHAYAVSLVFGTGPIVANVVVAPSPEAAAALILHAFMKEIQPKEELSGVAVVPIAPEWLSRAKDAIEGRERGQVLHLVPTPEPPSQADGAAHQEWWRQYNRDIDRRREAEDVTPEPPMPVSRDQLSEAQAAEAQMAGWPQPLMRYCSRHPLHPIRDGICSACAPPLSGGAA